MSEIFQANKFYSTKINPGHSVRFSRYQTGQSSFYLCCGYKEVNVYFVQRLVTSNMTEKKN